MRKSVYISLFRFWVGDCAIAVSWLIDAFHDLLAPLVRVVLGSWEKKLFHKIIKAILVINTKNQLFYWACYYKPYISVSKWNSLVTLWGTLRVYGISLQS